MKTSNTSLRTMIPVFMLLTLIILPVSVHAHVTPSIRLISFKDAVRKIVQGGDLRLKRVTINDEQATQMKAFGNWDLLEENYNFIIKYDENHSLSRVVVQLKEYSRHGTIVIAVGMNSEGKVVNAFVTDVQNEVLQWIQPLLQDNFMQRFKGADTNMSPTTVLEGINSVMTRSYAKRIANAVKRSTQLFEVVFK